MEDPFESGQPQMKSQIEHDLKKEEVFTKFTFSDLKTATKNFSDEIVSEKSSNVVYKGDSQKLGSIAVKKFKTTVSPDPDQFAKEAQRVCELKHKRLVDLIGYCCDENERLLVAEFLPSDTLAKRLFDQKSQGMEWSMRLRVAYCIAEALDYCSTAGFASYNNLSAYTVLFDECFGLMKESEDGRKTTGSVNPETVAYRFGFLLLHLLTGNPNLVSEMIHGQNVIELMDPKLEENFPTEEAVLVLGLAAQCLKDNIPSYELLQMTKQHAEGEPLRQRQLRPTKVTLVGGARRARPNRGPKKPNPSAAEIQEQLRGEVEQQRKKNAEKELKIKERPNKRSLRIRRLADSVFT